MKNKLLVRIISALLLVVMLASMAVSCETAPSDGETTAAETTDEVTTEAEVTATETTAAPETEEETTAEETTEAATTKAETTEAPVQEIRVVDVKWHMGYMGSDTHTTYKEQLNVTGTPYSYSDIIRLGEAGSTIAFTDDNTNANGDEKFASAAAYVFSSWVLKDGLWIFDADGYKARGTTASYTDKDGARTYYYTSKKDGECLRLCFRSGHTTSFTPAAFPEVKVRSVIPAEAIDESKAVAIPEGAATIETNWNIGYVGSATNPNGFANKICTTEKAYSYTDVIELGKKGTKVVFTDPDNGVTSSNAYAVSSWKKNGSEWVLDLDGVNLAGGNGSLVISKTAFSTIYTYVSSSDNECIRFCYRSNKTTTGHRDGPTIYIVQTDETGTADDLVTLKHWIESDKLRAFYEDLEGLTFSVIGDSYLAGNGLDKSLVWPALLAEKYGMEYKNYGVNGSAMSNHDPSRNPMVNRYTDMAMNDPDIIILEGGRNDYNVSAPIGEDGSADTKTMKGAARYLITKLQERYPNALIICVTCWEVGGNKNSAGYYCSDYGRAFLEVCEDMNVPCINAMDQEATGVYMTSADFRAQYCMTPSDISHLNADGMKKVLPVFEKYIAEFYAKK